MRLTLRTLLAYLDDTLDPAEIKEIGQKVAESDTAQELIARIKQVTRRRRLTTPPATGPNARFDANTIAEYLDNVLPAEQVAEVEKTCLESDVHLAEIAACHQILTLVLGEPALVPPPARQRMYALAQGKGAVARKPRPRAAAVPGAHGDGSEADETLLLGLPPLGRGRRARWLVPALAALLLVALGVAIWLAIPPRPTVQVASSQPPARRDQTPPDRPKDGPSAKGATTPVNEPGYWAQTADRLKPLLAAASSSPNGSGPGTTPTIGRAPRPSKERKAVGKLAQGTANLLLQRPSGDQGSWRRLKPEADLVFTDDLLLTLPGYRSEVRLDNKVHLLLWGNVSEQLNLPLLESAVRLHAVPAQKDDPADVDFTLDRGRVTVSNPREKPARVRVRFHEEAWELTLEPGAEVGVELFGREGGYETGEGPFAELWLMVLKGRTSLRAGYTTVALQAPPGPASIRWDNRGPGVQGPIPMQEIPPWWEKNPPVLRRWADLPPREQSERKKAFEDMQQSLDELSGRLFDKPIKVLDEELDATKPKRRELAVFCLGAVDDLPRLLDALRHEKVDVRDAAVMALRHWLGRRPGQDKLLRQALADKNYTTTSADTILQLLHTFSAEDRAKKQTYEALIEYLGDERIGPEIRHLAHWHLSRLSPEGRKIPYNAVGGSQQERQDAYEQWKKLLADGKLPPRPPAQPPK